VGYMDNPIIIVPTVHKCWGSIDSTLVIFLLF
jgi:hypothetical protein